MTAINYNFEPHANPKVHSTGSGTHWEFISARNRVRVVGSSSLEYDHYVLLDLDPSVVAWTHQVEVEVDIGGKRRSRVLDSKVRYRGGRKVVYEVKPEKYVRDPRTLEQMSVQEAWAKENGFESKLVTEKSIRDNEILLENCHKMRPWLTGLHTVNENVARLVLGLVAGRPKAFAVQDIAAELQLPPNELVPVLVKSYLDGQVALDVEDRRFGLGTKVSIQKGL